jgi:urease accessory protein
MTDRTPSAEAEPASGRVLDLDVSIDRLSQPPGDWLIWQLVDSAFPIGGFAHSAGLEAAWQHGEICRRDDLIEFLHASLEQSGHAMLPFVAAAFDSPGQISDFDSLCDVFMTNHVANRASRAQGRALLAAAERLSPSQVGKLKSKMTFAHFAPAFGACMRALGVERETARRMFCFLHLRGILSAAVRLNIIGPMEAQIVQHATSANAERILKKCEALSLDDIAQTAPLLELWQGTQDRLYSRLFQS